MELTISVDPSLGNDWYGRIERMVNLELSTVSHRVDLVSVSLVASLAAEGRHKCRVRLTFADDQEVTAVMISSDPKTCILDALRRSKRELVRKLTIFRGSEGAAQSNSL